MPDRLQLYATLLALAAATTPAATQPPSSCGEGEVAAFAALALQEKVATFKALSPPGRRTGSRAEHQMECLLLSVDGASLSQFKFELEYDGDYKDIVEYVFHDIDDKARQQRILSHFQTAPPEGRVKVLTDVDDTMYANLVDARYEKGTLYPGVAEFYAAIAQEPFAAIGTPVTTLSARPDPVAGVGEERSLRGVRAKTADRLRPSAQSGALTSSAVGTLQTLVRANPINARYLDSLARRVPFDQEDRIGEVKFANCQHFSAVFPEYRYVFVGDSGQADSLTAQLLMHGDLAAGTSRPIVSFIHDLTQSIDDRHGASPAFRRLTPGDMAGEPPGARHGVIVFKNYIHAARMAYALGQSLDNLIDADDLAAVTQGALEAFERIGVAQPSHRTLKAEYKADAEQAASLLALAVATPAAEEIRRILDSAFWRDVARSGGPE